MKDKIIALPRKRLRGIKEERLIMAPLAERPQVILRSRVFWRGWWRGWMLPVLAALLIMGVMLWLSMAATAP